MAYFHVKSLAMNAVAIIPARFNSSRFPGKPLIRIGSRTMIRRVYEQVKSLGSLTDVIVATDDARIEEHVQSFGGKVVMTHRSHRSGTERCAEVVSRLPVTPDVVLNVQGDVPFIAPGHLQQVIDCFLKEDTQIATLMKKITDGVTLANPNIPKVVFDIRLCAIYFSRSPIPHLRDVEKERWHEKFNYYKHIGIYGYRPKILMEIVNLPEGRLELAESLEQLRWIENGYRIQLSETKTESLAIDTPEDLSRVLAKMEGEKYLE